MDRLASLLEAGGAVMVPILIGSLFAWGLGLHAWIQARSADVDVAAVESQRLLLGSLVVVLPLLGLLGTVMGIIDTFEVIRQVGRGEPRLMARGIREALVATETGLVTALPALVLHHLVSSTLEKLRDAREARR